MATNLKPGVASVTHASGRKLFLCTGHPEHIVRLYEDETSLYRTVADLVAGGLADGDSCLLIATQPHLLGMTKELRFRGHDCRVLENNRRLVKVDAEQILPKIAPGADLDAALSRQVLRDLISGVAGSGAITVYGEIVDLLWKSGKPQSAIRLEQIWNDLQQEHAIRLLCGYDSRMFGYEDRALLDMVCNEHSLCMPADTYLAEDDRSRLRRVVVLEQRARELEAEVQRRRAATEELTRFNRAAVGREMRIIELKNEVNELCARLGEIARYAATREPELSDAGPCPPVPEPATALAPLESILKTEELQRRPSRPPQYETEHSALMQLIQALADTPRTILQVLADKVLEVLRADSAGLSLLTENGERFYWAAIAGMWKPHLGGGTPRNFGPCGDVLDCERPLLFTHWELRYPYLLEATPLAEEGLLVPFFVRDKAVGTIWAIAHNPERKFDAEDLRLLESLGRFASAAHQAVQRLSVFDQRQAAMSLLEDHMRQESRLRDANAQLGRANEDLSHFAFAASHDLQEPLRMIATYSQLLIRGSQGRVDDEASTCVRFITEGANRMQQLLADLLAYTRVIGDGQVSTASVVHLDAALRNAMDNCRAAIEECGATITSGPLPQVQGYEPHFVQLFQNLIGNAIKYRGPQPLRVHISATPREGHWRFAVTDNGIGIEPEFHQHIFGVFKRLHGQSIPGTGIGLAICQRIVERYGGRIWVESEKNNGATFYFTLPAAHEAPDDER